MKREKENKALCRKEGKEEETMMLAVLLFLNDGFDGLPWGKATCCSGASGVVLRCRDVDDGYDDCDALSTACAHAHQRHACNMHAVHRRGRCAGKRDQHFAMSKRVQN